MVSKRSRSPRKRPATKRGGFAQKKIFWIGSAIIAVILVQVFVLQDEGVYTLLRFRKEIRQMKAHISRLEIEKAQLESERDRLLNDPDYLERIARERFRMAKPGEKVFHVVIETKEAEQ